MIDKKTIVFDFDGVIHKGYTGWKDGSIYGEIDYELLNYIGKIMKDYYVVVSSNRPAKQIVDKLNTDPNVALDFEVFDKDMDKNMYWNKDNVIGVTNGKAVGILYIDDRAFRYNNNLDELKDFINSLDSVQKVEFLPYHNMGEQKWTSLGFSYPLSGVRNANEADIQRAKEISTM